MERNKRTHARHSVVCLAIRSAARERSPSRSHRERGPATSTRGLSPKMEATGSDELRSHVLGRSLPTVGPTGAVPWCTSRPTLPRAGNGNNFVDYGPDCPSRMADVQSCPATASEIRRLIEPMVGANSLWRTPDPWRTEHARHRSLGARGLPNHPHPPAATRTNMADVSSQPSRSNGIDGFLTVPTITMKVLDTRSSHDRSVSNFNRRCL
jgi:hypothetical protein